MENKDFYSFDEVKDTFLGKRGTLEREKYEQDVSDAIHTYMIGDAIKAERSKQHLTQEQLGERIGVKKSQISRIENGHSITIPTMSRIFKALGIKTATLDLGLAGKVLLW